MVSTSQKIAVTVSASRKKLSSKVTVSIREKNPSTAARMKDSFKNKFPLDRKKRSRAGVSGKTYKKKMVCTSQKILFHYLKMKHSLKNKFPQYGKTAFSDKKIKENGFHWQENVLLLKLVPNNFNNGFQHQ